MLIIVRGGGDLATGTIHRLHSAGYELLVLESEYPSAIRRQVSACEAIYEGQIEIEGMQCVRIDHYSQAESIINKKEVPIFIDPDGESIKALKPDIVIDAIIAKKNLGTNRYMAPLTIALGPGFEAGVDCDIVIETKRGHNLGRIIKSGTAYPNSGIPGNIGGYTKERVIHSPCDGVIRTLCNIGDFVKEGQNIAYIIAENEMVGVKATITGLLRGVIRNCYPVTKGFKIADIDPRKEEYENCFTISDKARCIAGSVLECVCRFEKGK